MGQCVSSKSAAALRGTNTGDKNRPGTPPMFSRPPITPTLENNNNNNKITEEIRGTSSSSIRRRGGNYTRGIATSFGFRKRSTPNNASIISNSSTPSDNDNRITTPTESIHDSNGNDTDCSTNGTRLAVSRLPAPKKESAATKGVSRFGFRQRATSAVGGIKTPPNDNASIIKVPNTIATTKAKNINNNFDSKPRAKSVKSVTIASSVPKHKLTSEGNSSNYLKSKQNRPTSALPIPSVIRCNISSTQLPKPQIVRVRPVEDVKTAKTATNISRKDHRYGYSEESGLSSKEGSVTGDSGVGSASSGAESDLARAADLLSEIRPPRPRNLGTIISPRGTFDLRDLTDDGNVDEVVTEVAVIPLPKLPSVFSPTNQVSTGVVRERTQQYQRQIERSFSGRSLSESRRPITRMPFGDDSEEEKTYRDSVSTEKCRNINSIHNNRRDLYEKGRTSNRVRSEERSRVSPNWSQGGESMLDNNLFDELGDISISVSEKNPSRTPIKEVPDLISPSQLLSTLSSSGGVLNEKHGAIPKNSCRSVLVTIEDPFTAMASSGGSLLDDEPSPQDSLISSLTEESEENTRKSQRRASKTSITDDPKEQTSPASPGTPTNTSLSLSEGRDFLIDDEISDQPALTFDKSINSSIVEDHGLCDNISENILRRDRSDSNEHINDITLVNDTPKRLRRRHLSSLAASVDTLSPCDSITSDDLMMDFDLSQNSGIDDSNDRLYAGSNSALHSMDESTLRSELEKASNRSVAKEWTPLLSHAFSNKDISTRPANFRSRTNTPSSVPESPRLLNRARISGAPLGRFHRPSPPPSLYQSIPSEDESSTAATQELLEIKSLVLKLQNVLQQKESLNPFDNSMKNGLHENGLNGINEKETVDSDDPDDIIQELQRQVIFLHAQLEDRDRTVRQLEGRMAKFSLGAHLAKMNGEHREIATCNSATQTDKVRPLSAGPSLLQSPPNEAGPGFISMNDHQQHQIQQYQRRSARPHSMVEMSTLLPQSKGSPLKLWRSPGEPPPPSMFIQNSASLPRSISKNSRLHNAITS